MDIFLLRHFESIKNTQITFSSLDDKEELTDDGIKQGKLISKNLKNILNIKKLKAKQIYCANSKRAIQTAELIKCECTEIEAIQTYDELLSTKSMEILGKTKDDVRKFNPQFIRELELYDAGLFSSYDFHRDVDGNKKRQYEKNVMECIQKIIQNSVDENAKIIVLHNSSITAAVIGFARKLCNYPENFYGKIIADNGNLFWIHKDLERETFITANCDTELLLKHVKENENDS